MNVVLEACKLAVYRGNRRVLNGLDLAVPAAQTVAVSGPSGSGKSTLLAALAGLIKADSGEVFVAGEQLPRSEQGRARVRLHRLGIVFQGDEFLPELTLLENVALPSMLRDRTTRVADYAGKVEVLFERLGIAGLQERRPHEVSMGQLQRAAIARAVLGEPVAILADEPTSALDRSAAHDALQLLLGLAREQHVALLLVTHDPVIADMCDRRVMVVDGMVEDGPRADIRLDA